MRAACVLSTKGTRKLDFERSRDASEGGVSRRGRRPPACESRESLLRAEEVATSQATNVLFLLETDLADETLR